MIRAALAPLTRPGRLLAPAAPAEPEAVLFSRLRLSLTLMYAAVLAAMLAAVGLALYVSLRGQLLSAAASRVLIRADFHADPWAANQPSLCTSVAAGRPPAGAGNPRGAPQDSSFWVTCFDPNGRVLIATADPPPPGVANQDTPAPTRVGALVPMALRDGTAWDVKDGGPGVGPLIRGAKAVRDSSGRVVGVAQSTLSAADQYNTLALVRNLLLGLGALVVALASGGGWLLASRALAPARLAFARQQAFVSDASHELRTPLTLMRANAELLLRHRDRFTPDDAEVLDDIVSETEHMSRLANDLLTLARLDAGRLTLEREVVDLSDLAGGLVRRVAALAAEKQITLSEDHGAETGAAGDGGRALVYADPQYTEEAGLILVENAVKYTPAGGSVSVRTERRNGQVSLSVEDTGPGIPKEHLDRLGERFFRADASRNRSTGGSGLGLAIAFRIARAHGGAVRIESEVGQGTRATLSLPAAALN